MIEYDCTKDGCIKAIKYADKITDKDLTRDEYDKLDILPSSYLIERKFGSWFNAVEISNI